MRLLLIAVIVLAAVKEGYCVTAIDIQSEARSHIASTHWSYANDASSLFPENTNKCNLFVDDVLRSVGVTVPDRHPWEPFRHYPIAANTWALSSSADLLNTHCWESCSNPIPGDVLAIGASGSSGHVGIVTGSRKTTSAAAYEVVETDWGFRSGQQPTCWRYRYTSC